MLVSKTSMKFMSQGRGCLLKVNERNMCVHLQLIKECPEGSEEQEKSFILILWADKPLNYVDTILDFFDVSSLALGGAFHCTERFIQKHFTGTFLHAILSKTF